MDSLLRPKGGTVAAGRAGRMGEVRRGTKREFERLQTERKLELMSESSVESSHELQLTSAPPKG
jgi:hypothetical protein